MSRLQRVYDRLMWRRVCRKKNIGQNFDPCPSDEHVGLVGWWDYCLIFSAFFRFSYVWSGFFFWIRLDRVWVDRKLWSESIDALVELGLFWDYKRVRLVGSSLLKRRTFLNLRHCTHLKALQRKMLALSKGKAFFSLLLFYMGFKCVPCQGMLFVGGLCGHA
jgi:hypothetical protein